MLISVFFVELAVQCLFQVSGSLPLCVWCHGRTPRSDLEAGTLWKSHCTWIVYSTVSVRPYEWSRAHTLTLWRACIFDALCRLFTSEWGRGGVQSAPRFTISIFTYGENSRGEKRNRFPNKIKMGGGALVKQDANKLFGIWLFVFFSRFRSLVLWKNFLIVINVLVAPPPRTTWAPVLSSVSDDSQKSTHFSVLTVWPCCSRVNKCTI